MNRRKLQRRTERAAQLHSKWALRRVQERRLERWTDELFADNAIRLVDNIRYGRFCFTGGRRWINENFLFNAGAGA